MATLVGRVGLVVKGAWDSSVAYATMDVVTYNNSTYIAKQAVPAGTLPTNTTYWELSLDASLLANKVISAVNGNLAGLDSNGDLIDAGWSADKTTTAVTPGNPISIPSLKSAQTAIDPIVTFSSAVSSVTLKVANGSDSTAPGYAVSTDISEDLGTSASGTWNVRTGVFTKSDTTTIQLMPHEVILAAGNNYVSSNGTNISLSYHNGEMAALSDISLIAESMSELGDFVTHNNMGTSVDLTGYNTSSNKYTFPSDGYVMAMSDELQTGFIRIPIYGANNVTAGYLYMNIVGKNQIQSLYVKKGMKCYILSMSTGAAVTFQPFM